MLWYLLLLIPLVAVAYIVWAYRRKSIERAAASRDRAAQILVGRPQQGGVAEPSAGAGAGADQAPGAAAVFRVQERLLGPAETLVYRLLKAGLNDHEVFAQVALVSVVGVPDAVNGYDREQQRRRLAQHRLDFVVCDKSMRIVAAVELDEAEGADTTGARRFKAECLDSAGIRLVRISRAALPRREAVRALVLGGGA